MMEYFYELTMDKGTVMIQSDCESHEFELAVKFVRQLEDYNLEILLGVINAIERKAELFVPDNITNSFDF